MRVPEVPRSAALPLVVDVEPLLDEARRACRAAGARMAELKAQIRRFEDEDLPGFERWYHATFGAWITEARELGEILRRREIDLAQARRRHWQRFFGDECLMADSGYGAEAGHRRARARGDQDADDEAFFDDPIEGAYGPEHEASAWAEDGYFDDESASHYDEDVEAVRRFEDLFVRRTAAAGGFRYASSRRREDSRGRTAREDRTSEAERTPHRSEGGDAAAESDPVAATARDSATLEERVKSRYRRLARRLHPDAANGAERTDLEKSLWHEAQVAYRAKDLVQLDVLLALADVLHGHAAPDASLGELRRAERELERLLTPLRQRLARSRAHRAWGFAALADHRPLRLVIERELQTAIRDLRRRLHDAMTQIVRLGAPRDEASLARDDRSASVDLA